MKMENVMQEQRIDHPIPPTWDSNSVILILGSFPSVKSREMAYFYGHPRNRFWQVLGILVGDPVPATVSERRAFLLRHKIAVWDVIASCTITGSSDSSIQDVTPNDLTPILTGSSIRQIFVNGKKAAQLYERYLLPKTGKAAVTLPSTSPANAAWSLPKLTEAWRVLLDFIG